MTDRDHFEWPEKGAEIPTFTTPQEAVEFMAGMVGVAASDVRLQVSSEGRETPSAWFPGIPQTALFYSDTAKGTYRPTEGATGIVRKVQSGDYTTEVYCL